MLLALDVGNTNLTVGIFADKELRAAWRLATRHEQTSDELGLWLRQLLREEGIDPSSLTGVVVSSVVPPLDRALEEGLVKYLRREPFFIAPGVRTGVPVKTDNPREVGADRVVNAAAGFALFGGPLIVVDFGTAITLDVISNKGEYLGGAIAPGIGIACEALFARAARLPRVDLTLPAAAIGRNTVQSMQAGVLFGFAGLVDALVQRMWQELGCKTLVVATGGLAHLVSAASSTIERVEPYLTLIGLRIIYERNC
ncbi:type III pantothenate kinase [Desulfothermobacter acidiphilus]|uniref:type III pantothenate kinase n=1 Tax=Desulfothermobacter acidiphilus TaxID=1938353 RepID=UPI003F89F203